MERREQCVTISMVAAQKCGENSGMNTTKINRNSVNQKLCKMDGKYNGLGMGYAEVRETWVMRCQNLRRKDFGNDLVTVNS